jgi:cytoskeletal protein CcmA (bactofilin family)
VWGRRTATGRDRLVAIVGEGCEIEGRCRLVGAALVEGRITGDRLIADELVIGDRGAVTADVHADAVVVRGSVTGNIAAAERVELASTARVTGDIETPVLAMADGAVLEGHCRITTRRGSDAPAEAVTVSTAP